jgi:hypothetical protein
MLFNVPGGISADDALQLSPFQVLLDDDIGGGFHAYEPASIHPLRSF